MLKNHAACHGRIVLVERGGVPIVDKALAAQAAGALGVVVTDTGDCTTFNQVCSAGASKVCLSVSQRANLRTNLQKWTNLIDSLD
jgi:hypothetical protein